MKILITGAAGAIGSHVAERFSALGHDVVGIDAMTDYYDPKAKEETVKELAQKGVSILRLDLAKDDVTPALSGVDVVYHFAAQPGISKDTSFETYVRNNIVATHRLLEAARKSDSLRAFIHISTSSVYGVEARGDETAVPAPTSYYGVTKLAAEQLALSYHREYGMPVSVLRLFSVYGERERPEKLYRKLIQSMLEGKTFPLHEGSEKHVRSYTYVSDIVDGCVAALEHFDKVKGEIFNLGNDHTATTGEGIAIIENIFGGKADIVVVPKRAGDQKETAAHIGKAKRMFGYEPKVSLAEGLARQVAWQKKKFESGRDL